MKNFITRTKVQAEMSLSLFLVFIKFLYGQIENVLYSPFRNNNKCHFNFNFYYKKCVVLQSNVNYIYF